MSISIRFVLHKGELEAKASLLAASLKKYLEKEIELVALLPTPESKWGKPQSVTLSFLQSLGVKFTTIENSWSDYPIGNKLSAFDPPTAKKKKLFLDTDILCTGDFVPHMLEQEKNILVKPADLVTFGENLSDWSAVETHLKIKKPDFSVITTVSEQVIPAYFNAGVICLDADKDFGFVWKNLCKKIDELKGIIETRPWLDQIGIPFTISKLDLSVGLLSEDYNYPAHLREDISSTSKLVHYHWPDMLEKHEALLREVSSLFAAHTELLSIFVNHSEWQGLLVAINKLSFEK